MTLPGLGHPTPDTKRHGYTEGFNCRKTKDPTTDRMSYLDLLEYLSGEIRDAGQRKIFMSIAEAHLSNIVLKFSIIDEEASPPWHMANPAHISTGCLRFRDKPVSYNIGLKKIKMEQS